MFIVGCFYNSTCKHSNWINNEGGRIDNIDNELKLRDSNYNRHKRSQWDHAFADGAKDAKNGLIKRY